MPTRNPTPVLALDFGGTKASAALIDPGSLRLDDHTTIATSGDAERTIRSLFDVAAGLLRGATPAAIGISFGGPIATATGTVVRSHHRPGWTNLPLAARTSTEFRAPAFLVNDADAGALGEAFHGAGQPHRDVLYITISTGIGSGIVLDRRLRTGAHGLAGELGHLQVSPDGPECACGRHGCLEAHAAGPAIARQARHALAEAGHRGRHGDGTILRAACDQDVRRLTARHVSLAASLGDALAVGVLTSAGHAIGRACTAAALVLDPDIIVLGGGVTAAGDLLLEPARSAFEAGNQAPGVRLQTAALGDACTLVGAAVAATSKVIDP